MKMETDMARIGLMVVSCAAALVAGAMPSRSDLKKVQSAVNELMADDIAAMKSGRKKPAEVAANAENYAREATDEASKFLFYKGAFGLYVQGGAYDEAIRSVDALTAAVKDVPDKVLADIVREKLKRVPRKDGGAIFDLYERIDRRMRFGAECAKLEKQLKESPDDKSVRLELAVCRVQLGDWAKALEDFSALGGKEGDAVKAETSAPAKAADFWWTYRQDDETRDVFREHAAELYRKAIDGGKLEGIALALARKRVAEFGGAGADGGPSETAAPRQEEKPDVADEKSEPARPEVKVPNRKYDWTIPRNLKGVKTLDFDLGGVEPITFVAMPPGQGNLPPIPGKRPFLSKITRPFWVAQFPLTVAQYGKYKEVSQESRIPQLAESLANEKDAIVFAAARTPDVVGCFKWLNENYGSQLPKGWVFRPLTQGEAVYAQASTVTSGRDYNYTLDFQKRLEFFHAKGLFMDCKTRDEMSKAARSPLHPQFDFPDYALMVRAREVRKGRKIASFRWRNLNLDRIALPGWEDKGWSPELVAAAEKVVNRKPVETDAFRYCSDDTPGCRFATFAGWMPPVVYQQHGFLLIRVGVGYDYVGEWERQNGKK